MLISVNREIFIPHETHVARCCKELKITVISTKADILSNVITLVSSMQHVIKKPIKDHLKIAEWYSYPRLLNKGNALGTATTLLGRAK